MSVRSIRSVHSRSVKENAFIDISCSDNSSQYQSVSINTVDEEEEGEESEERVKYRHVTSDKSVHETCNRMDSLSVKCSSGVPVNERSDRKSASSQVTSGSTNNTRQRKSGNAKYHTLPVSSGKNRSSNIVSDSGKKGATLMPSNGATATVKKSVIRSWLSKFSKKSHMSPAAVDQSTQTELERPISCSSVNHHFKCVKCAPIDYCCVSQQQQQQQHYQQLITSNCIQCPSSLLVPSVMNNFNTQRQFISTNDETGEISETIIQPCTTFYYAEPVDPSCLQCIATCPPSLLHCPGGYKYTSGAFSSSSCKSSCSSSSNSSGSSDICHTASPLAAAAATASASTTTSTGALQRDMYC